MQYTHTLSGGPLGGKTVDMTPAPEGAPAHVLATYAGAVEGAKKRAAYELRATEEPDGNVKVGAVFVGWV